MHSYFKIFCQTFKKIGPKVTFPISNDTTLINYLYSDNKMKFIFLFLCEIIMSQRVTYHLLLVKKMKLLQNIMGIIMHIAKADKVLR